MTTCDENSRSVVPDATQPPSSESCALSPDDLAALNAVHQSGIMRMVTERARR